MKKFRLGLLLLAAAIGVIWLSQTKPRPALTPVAATTAPAVVINGQRINVLLANTPAAREQGLSGRPGLAPNQGMLFLFDEPGYYAFWMKDMNFPIDIVWLDAGWRVVDLTPKLAPNSYPKIFRPKTPVQYVLELPSGKIAELALGLGDKVLLINT